MTPKDIVKFVSEKRSTPEYKRRKELHELYEAENPEILRKGKEKEMRGRTPNNVIPTAYYSTVVDTMGGYMFQDVQYVASDDKKQETLNAIGKENNFNIKDMVAGVGALAYNYSVEYITTDEKADIKVIRLNPLNTFLEYSGDAEPVVDFAVNVRKEGDGDHYLYVEKDLELTFRFFKNEVLDVEERQLFFDETPVADYRGQIIGRKAPFEVIVPYIQALDALISGNANEIDRLTDSILLLGRILEEEDLQTMEEWKIIQDLGPDEKAEYITKDASPEFRKFVSELLIREIHKHSHVVDWYSDDQGQAAASGKALRTRLFDMNMYSKRIEMAFIEGLDKRLRLIDRLSTALGSPIGEVEITLKRTMIDDFVDDAVKLATVSFITDITKRELLGVDEAKEQERLAKEAPQGTIPGMDGDGEE